MTFANQPTLPEPGRDAIDALQGATVLEFGTDWCGHCQAAEPLVRIAMDAHPHVRHIRIEDGRGRRLGRSFGVKLWPTFVFLCDGVELARLVRPGDPCSIADSLARIDPQPQA